METTIATPAIGNLGLYAGKLVTLIRESKADVITDETLTACIGFDTKPGGRGYGYLNTAIDRLLKEDGVRWRRVRSANCIKRSDFSEKHAEADSTRRHVHRSAKKAVMVLRTVDVSALTDEAKRQQLVREAQLGTLAIASSPGMVKKLDARTVNTEINPAKLLEVMVQNGKT